MQYSVTNTNGLTAKWISLGATLAELHVPDRHGVAADVVLGFDDESGYSTGANQHFGCTTGRYANRIQAGRFTLDGVEYKLAINNGPNHLHGGSDRALDKVEWQMEPLPDERGVRFAYTSPDGEESFPGNLDLVVTYTLTEENAFRIDYRATTDRPTIVNLTNHSYFNLAGHGTESVLDHELRVDADSYTPVDDTSIPTGEIESVNGTPFDFRQRRRVGDRIGELIESAAGGYDHNFVLNNQDGKLREVAELYEPTSGRLMRVATDQPGVQVYTGNGLSGQQGKAGRKYAKRSAICLETQKFPDSPNQPAFPSTVLRRGETYRHVCVYEFDVE